MNDLHDVFPEIALIENPKLKQGVIQIWTEIMDEMPWKSLHDVPQGSKAIELGELVRHIRGVTNMALAICEVAQKFRDRSYDKDLLLAACLLHDASKPVELEPVLTEGGELAGFRKTEIGKNVQHAVYAAHKAINLKLPYELVSLIITHSPLSLVRDTSWEATALFYADFADTDAGLTLSNGKPHSTKFLGVR